MFIKDASLKGWLNGCAAYRSRYASHKWPAQWLRSLPVGKGPIAAKLFFTPTYGRKKNQEEGRGIFVSIRFCIQGKL
jgi:hypothetical protein